MDHVRLAICVFSVLSVFIGFFMEKKKFCTKTTGLLCLCVYCQILIGFLTRKLNVSYQHNTFLVFVYCIVSFHWISYERKQHVCFCVCILKFSLDFLRK